MLKTERKQLWVGLRYSVSDDLALVPLSLMFVKVQPVLLVFWDGWKKGNKNVESEFVKAVYCDKHLEIKVES